MLKNDLTIAFVKNWFWLIIKCGEGYCQIKSILQSEFVIICKCIHFKSLKHVDIFSFEKYDSFPNWIYKDSYEKKDGAECATVGVDVLLSIIKIHFERCPENISLFNEP